MEEIAAATREQSSGIDHINSAINQLDSTTQRNAALVEQSRSAAANLEGQAEQLTHLVSTFKVNGPHADAQPRRTDAPATPTAHYAPTDIEADWAPA